MAQDTQYWSFKYILGTEYSAKTEASEISPVKRKSSVALVRLKVLEWFAAIDLGFCRRFEISGEW
jgi:hypothetical protein